MQKTENKTAVVLLTGYLGSGKTTLIEFILKHQNQYKVAVIQNEFSDEMGIESPLMQDSSGKPFDRFYELPNGCICCTAKEGLLTAVEYLIKCETIPLDFILVETNGLADPSSTVKTFWVDDEFHFPAELRSIHTVVPAHRFFQLNNDNMVFKKQIIYADTILLNYIDKSDEVQLLQVEKELTQLNPTATIHRTNFCNIQLDKIFNADGFNHRTSKIDILQVMITAEEHISHEIIQEKNSHQITHLCQENGVNNHCQQQEHHENNSQQENHECNPHQDLLSDNQKSLGHILSHHEHPSQDIKTHFFEWSTALEYKILEQNLGNLLWENESIVILRVKGLINIIGNDNMFSLQGVEDIFEIKESDIKWPQGVERKSKFLFICQNVSKEKLIELVLNPLE